MEDYLTKQPQDETRRLSSRNTAHQMLNFITQNMIQPENEHVKDEERIPLPEENEWKTIIEQVQNNGDLPQNYAVGLQTQTLAGIEPPNTAEITETNNETFTVTIESPPEKEIVIEKQQVLLVAETRTSAEEKQKKRTLKKRLIGFFRRTSFRTKKKT